MKDLKYILNGVLTENPTFVLLLGMCPTLGTTGSALTGMSMGLATAGVLVCSNAAVSALRRFIPGGVRIPAYIVVIASFVTVLQMLMKAWLPSLDAMLGIFVPLIVVNCILLGRAESFAGRHGVLASICDGLGIGLGFTLSLTLLGCLREIAGTGHVFGIEIYPEKFGALVFVLAPGAFIALGFMIALFNKIRGKC